MVVLVLSSIIVIGLLMMFEWLIMIVFVFCSVMLCVLNIFIMLYGVYGWNSGLLVISVLVFVM